MFDTAVAIVLIGKYSREETFFYCGCFFSGDRGVNIQIRTHKEKYISYCLYYLLSQPSQAQARRNDIIIATKKSNTDF